MKKTPDQLRSHRWFGSNDLRSFSHRSRAKQMGYALEDFQGKPVIAIINTWSDLSTCHSHFRTRAEEVKRGVWQAGGFPVELPAMTVNETYMKPSPMMYRNFLAMETEELLRSQPIDGAVLMGGNDLMARINRDDLLVDENSVLVLQNAGPLGGPGMPEWGMLPIPQKLLVKGVRNMLRFSDARMSGTSYGACVLHVSPESYLGGPSALVRDGDLIQLDVTNRRLHLHVSDEELATRRAAWEPPTRHYERGFGALYAAHVTQPEQGCDFDFLHAGAETPEPEIH